MEVMLQRLLSLTDPSKVPSAHPKRDLQFNRQMTRA